MKASSSLSLFGSKKCPRTKQQLRIIETRNDLNFCAVMCDSIKCSISLNTMKPYSIKMRRTQQSSKTEWAKCMPNVQDISANTNEFFTTSITDAPAEKMLYRLRKVSKVLLVLCRKRWYSCQEADREEQLSYSESSNTRIPPKLAAQHVILKPKIPKTAEMIATMQIRTQPSETALTIGRSRRPQQYSSRVAKKKPVTTQNARAGRYQLLPT